MQEKSVMAGVTRRVLSKNECVPLKAKFSSAEEKKKLLEQIAKNKKERAEIIRKAPKAPKHVRAVKNGNGELIGVEPIENKEQKAARLECQLETASFLRNIFVALTESNSSEELMADVLKSALAEADLREKAGKLIEKRTSMINFIIQGGNLQGGNMKLPSGEEINLRAIYEDTLFKLRKQLVKKISKAVRKYGKLLGKELGETLVGLVCDDFLAHPLFTSTLDAKINAMLSKADAVHLERSTKKQDYAFSGVAPHDVNPSQVSEGYALEDGVKNTIEAVLKQSRRDKNIPEGQVEGAWLDENYKVIDASDSSRKEGAETKFYNAPPREKLSKIIETMKGPDKKKGAVLLQRHALASLGSPTKIETADEEFKPIKPIKPVGKVREEVKPYDVEAELAKYVAERKEALIKQMLDERDKAKRTTVIRNAKGEVVKTIIKPKKH